MGESRWEIYAWALRQVMLEEGNFTPTDVTFKIRNAFNSYMAKEKDAIHPDDIVNEETAPKVLLKSRKSLLFIKSASKFQRSQSHMEKANDQKLEYDADPRNLMKSQVQKLNENLL